MNSEMSIEEHQALFNKVTQEIEAFLDRPPTPTGLVLEQDKTERARQDEKWGGSANDDKHTIAEWVNLIKAYADWAEVMQGMGSLDKARNRLVQVAAMAVAAVESVDRQSKQPENLSAAEDYVRKKAGLPALPRACSECQHLHLQTISCLYPHSQPVPGGAAYFVPEATYHLCRPLCCPLTKKA